MEVKLEAVARCLAKHDGEFISAAEWSGDRGDTYRDAARDVLRTIDNVERGVLSGGLPS